MLKTPQKIYCIQNKGGYTILSLKGHWVVSNLDNIKDMIKKLNLKEEKLIIDCSNIQKMDISGAYLIKKIINNFKKKKINVSIEGIKQDYKALLDIVEVDLELKFPKRNKLDFLQNIGKYFVDIIFEIICFLSYLGEIINVIFITILNPKKIRIKEILYEIEYTGVYATLIVALVGMLVGIVLAYQGATQLSRFGASIFIVDLISLSITREMAPLLTAIMVAGRSGSSYTASIGSMVLNQEIDSLKIIGIHPLELLVIPKLIAMMIVLPLLIFICDVVGIASGIYLSNIILNLDMTTLIVRLKTTLPLTSFFIGILKGPIFAMPIVLISCFRGFCVKKDSEELGINTTKSVVSTIFTVIIIDAVLSIVFQKLGV